MSSRLEQKFNSKKKFKKFKIQIQKPHFNSKRGVAEYFGETGRNAFTRGEEHLLNKQAEDENKSVLKLHSNHHHDGRDVRYSMRVTGVHNDSLERQITEAVNIANFRGPALMNRRGELGGVRIERQQYRRWGANN